MINNKTRLSGIEYAQGYCSGFVKALKHLERGSIPNLENVSRLEPFNNGYRKGWKDAQNFDLDTWDNGNVID